MSRSASGIYPALKGYLLSLCTSAKTRRGQKYLSESKRIEKVILKRSKRSFVVPCPSRWSTPSDLTSNLLGVVDLRNGSSLELFHLDLSHDLKSPCSPSSPLSSESPPQAEQSEPIPITNFLCRTPLRLCALAEVHIN